MNERRIAVRVRRLLFCGAAAGLAALANSGVVTQLSADSTDAPTFNRDVAPILYEKCAFCHRTGAVGPMALTSFTAVRPWGRAIKTRVTRREMPPWSADSRWGHFQND